MPAFGSARMEAETIRGGEGRKDSAAAPGH
mgnify:CR=1 FL=1